MKRYAGSLVLLAVLISLFFLTPQACAQDKLSFAAGTPEDHDLQAISSEPDAAKKLAMYQDFVQKYSSNPAAVVYGDWQISQAYQSTADLTKALEYGDKALAGSPRNLDIIVSQGSIAQQAKDNARLMDYAAKGGAVCNSIEKQPKPDGMTDDDFKRQVAEDKSAAQTDANSGDAGFNVIASGGTTPRPAWLHRGIFPPAFPDSKFQEQVSNYAMYTLGPGQLNDQAAPALLRRGKPSPPNPKLTSRLCCCWPDLT